MSVKQKEQMMHLFKYLNQHNKYYADSFSKLGICWDDDIEKIFKKIPLLTKNEIRKQGANYFSETDEKIYTELTSGSSGVPLKCLKTESEKRIAGINIWKERRKRDPYVLPSNYFDLFDRNYGDFLDLREDRIIDLFNNMVNANPRWISGPITIIELMAKLIKKGVVSLKGVSIAYIELIGITALNETREFIEDAFQCKTINHYGTRETWCIAYECQKGHLHLQDNLLFMECVSTDSFEDSNGFGELIVTSFYNRVMPIVRYNLQDLGRIEYSECSCGNKSPRIILAGGRSMDIIRGKQKLGVYFNRVIYRLINMNHDCINRFKVIQKDYNDFDFYIVKSKEYTDATTQLLYKILMEDLGEETRFNFIFIDDLLPLPNGKFKNFECRIANE